MFVCHGNICRSPTAEGVARHHLRRKGLEDLIEVASAGTHGYHTGEPPDPRAVAAALRRGIDIAAQRARRVTPEDFDAFDLVLAMDQQNLANLERICPPQHREKLDLVMRYARSFDIDEVPDPYFGGEAGFDRVIEMVEDAIEGLLEELHRP
ncbi:MAG: low molecular weight protein-tyrosine-phosphatase [Pseudomonadota bacterium]